MLENIGLDGARAVLFGLYCPGKIYEQKSDDDSLRELESLLETAGGTAAAVLLQNRESPEKATLLGEGKVLELADAVKNQNASIVISDNQLSPSQIKNLEDGTGVAVIDRSMLILEIFAMHATTSEGKLQVEMAQLRYTLPRLTGRGKELSRLGGGGAGGGGARRGAGETKLETARRDVKTRLAAIKAQIDELAENRLQQRRQRDRSGLPKVAVIGYTNAGKSTLLNFLTGAGVRAENKLFATLDPTTRRLKLENGFEMLITDTVGFIRNLPHHLVEAFASTLDEVKYADLLINVADLSSPEVFSHIDVTKKLVGELGAGGIPMITALNKADAVLSAPLVNTPDSVIISAKTGLGVDRLLELACKKLSERYSLGEYLIPYGRGELVETAHEGAFSVVEKEFRDGGVYMKLMADAELAGRLREFKL